MNRNPFTSARWTRLTLLAAGVGATMALGACNLEDLDPPGPPATVPTVAVRHAGPEDEEAVAASEACMADQGIDLDVGIEISAANGSGSASMGDNDGIGTDASTVEAFTAAEAACQPFLDRIDILDLSSPVDGADETERLVTIQGCLADRGYDVTVEDGGLSGGISDSGGFEVALDECNPGPGQAGGRVMRVTARPRSGGGGNQTPVGPCAAAASGRPTRPDRIVVGRRPVGMAPRHGDEVCWVRVGGSSPPAGLPTRAVGRRRGGGSRRRHRQRGRCLRDPTVGQARAAG
ncbi:MAG: hypothetical protein ACK5RL_10740 [Acidimicrobiales bacterium]